MKKILTVGALLLVVGVLSVTIISEKVLGGVNNVILQDSLNNYVGTEDSMLGPASAAYYTYTNLNLADPGGRNAVIKFNLSSLPADAQVSSAELSLYYYTDTSATEAVVSKIITLRKVLRSWSEATVTQSESAPGTAWTTIYARGNDTDRSGAVSDTQTWNTGEFGWKNWNATADVQSFVTTPGDNNGWVLDLTNTPYDVAFYASEYNTDKTLRPKLTITYTSSTDLPPPDVTAPVVSAITVSTITSSGATISWTTDESSDSQVSYSADLNYGLSSVLDSSMVTSHSRTLTGLSASTAYNFVVKSRDSSGNLSVSSNQTFQTTATTVTPPTHPHPNSRTKHHPNPNIYSCTRYSKFKKFIRHYKLHSNTTSTYLVRWTKWKYYKFCKKFFEGKHC